MINGALAIVGMFVALMFGGFAGMWAIWPTAYRHGYAEGESDRHRHRRGDAQETTLLRLPTAGRISLERLADPTPLPGEPPFFFAGESEQGWAAEAAEYELLHQTETLPVSDVLLHQPEPDEIGSLAWVTQRLEEVRADEQAERLTDTGEMRALSDAWIAKMQGDSNEWIWGHLMRTSE